MSRFHETPEGPKLCTATVKQCPLTREDPTTLHWDNLQDAMTAYDVKQRSKTHGDKLTKKSTSPLLSKLLANNHGVYPEQTLRELDALMKFADRQPLAVVPSGSTLYNSQIPGKSLHDYDFMVFCEPFKSRQIISPEMNGTLDVTFVDLTKLTETVNRSSAVTEAFLGYQHGRALASLDSPWKPYLDSVELNMQKYFDLLYDTINSQQNQYTEPVSMDDKEALRNFKHVVRWNLYQKRWGTGRSMDPRLDDNERKLFLRALETGRLDAINR